MRLLVTLTALSLLITQQAAAQPELDAYRDCALQWAETQIDLPEGPNELAQAALGACSEERKTLLSAYEAAGFTEDLSTSYLESAETSIQSLLVAEITRWHR